MKLKHASHEFPPLYDKDSRILILGSFPSIKSREQKFFYGHPQNRFWPILAAIYGENELSTIEEKRDFALRHHIALYDSIEECYIVGSSDSSIRNVIPADLSPIFHAAKIRCIFTNGKMSARMFEKYQSTDIPMICLPSSSPANAAWSLEKLISEWKIIREMEETS